MKKSFYSLLTVLMIAAFMVSCSEDDDPPVAEIFYEVDANDPYTINFTTNDKNVNTYSWNFGDGNTSTEAEPTYTYSMSGDYTVTLTVNGDGGELTVTKDVTISASLEEMLSGGSAMANGKTWVLSKTATTSLDGVGSVNAEFVNNVLPGMNDVLDAIGLSPEWDNKFTFVHDGSYNVDNGNQNALAGWVYSYYSLGAENIVTMTEYGIFQVKHTAPTNATWTLIKDKDLVIDAANEGEEGVIEESVTLNPDKYLGYITFENGGFIGIQDYTTMAVIREISSERMVITVFLHSLDSHQSKPSNIITLSFDAE